MTSKEIAHGLDLSVRAAQRWLAAEISLKPKSGAKYLSRFDSFTPYDIASSISGTITISSLFSMVERYIKM